MTREDLLAAGWEEKECQEHWYLFFKWSHPDVRDGHLHTFEDAALAEETRKKADGGA